MIALKNEELITTTDIGSRYFFVKTTHLEQRAPVYMYTQRSLQTQSRLIGRQTTTTAAATGRQPPTQHARTRGELHCCSETREKAVEWEERGSFARGVRVFESRSPLPAVLRPVAPSESRLSGGEKVWAGVLPQQRDGPRTSICAYNGRDPEEKKRKRKKSGIAFACRVRDGRGTSNDYIPERRKCRCDFWKTRGDNVKPSVYSQV